MFMFTFYNGRGDNLYINQNVAIYVYTKVMLYYFFFIMAYTGNKYKYRGYFTLPFITVDIAVIYKKYLWFILDYLSA